MGSIQVQGHSRGAARCQRAPGAVHLAAVLGAVLAALALLPASSLPDGHLLPTAHAATVGSTAPIIHWDEHMIYAGHNNGFPLGPVGENALVHAERFPAGTYILKLVRGDLAAAVDGVAFCNTSAPQSALPGAVTVGAGGTFDYSFRWPSDASSDLWSICAYTHPVSGTDVPVGNTDDGPFSVLAPNPPAILLSASSIIAGNSVTITGQNFITFVPVIVGIYPCHSCGAPAVATANVAPDGSGSFAQSLTIPANQPAATLYAIAISENGVLDAGNDGSQALSVTAPVPTVAATATSVATPTTVATPTAVAASGSGGTGESGKSTGVPLVSLLAVLVLVLLAALSGTIAYVLTRRRTGGPVGGSAIPGTPPPNLYRDIPYLPMPPDDAPTTPVDFDAPTDPNIRFPTR